MFRFVRCVSVFTLKHLQKISFHVIRYFRKNETCVVIPLNKENNKIKKLKKPPPYPPHTPTLKPVPGSLIQLFDHHFIVYVAVNREITKVRFSMLKF